MASTQPHRTSTLAESTQRDDFRQRTAAQQSVSLAEVLYPVLMAMDSIHLQTDIEVGGIDQLLNFMLTRTLMERRGMMPEVLLMTPILLGTSGDGRKMSKSFGNAIAVSDNLADKFGKIMSVPDNHILQFFMGFGDVRATELANLRRFIRDEPFLAKKQAATLICALETGDLASAMAERERFERLHALRKVTDADCVQLAAPRGQPLLDALFSSGRFESKSQIRRLFKGGAIRTVDDDTPLGLNHKLERGCIVRTGRKRAPFKVTVE